MWNLTLKKTSGFLYLLLILLASFKVNGQSREDLEQRRNDIIQKIDDTNELLKETAQNKKVILSDLVIIESQIANRKLLLEQVSEEIELIEKDILSHAFEQEEKQRKVDSLKLQYNKVLRAVYRQRALHNPILALLSSESVSQGLLRANVYYRLQEYVGDKLAYIKKEQALLESQIASMSQDKDQKRDALKRIAEQSAKLENEQARQNVMIASLQEDESLLRENLDKQRKDRERMNAEIETVLKSELKASKEISSTDSAFDQLRGNMTAPVRGGVITSKYGKQPHPTMKNITISNNGVDMRAPLNAEVMAVYEGKVVSVSQMSGFGVTVILEHGKYYTVYSRLGEAFVKKGDQVSKDQVLGRLEVKDDSSEFHFEIWKDNKTQNPQVWLSN
ncbi:murein hydrolase activator EnvC family protein [Portibacter marinus]|uniref:murein hydrolase activator EnvC family protein n=1 Tax=Portibacter marinus TaxID=2898660 RepID=UPI001F39202B|nr:peptidoglycan DD-metalloendopeptidase family protein [Portibacter marinus]